MPITNTKLEHGRPEAEQAGVEQEADRAHAALDRAGELARAPLQVVGQREAEQVVVDPQRQPAAGALGDAGENRASRSSLNAEAPSRAAP
jgi:hypothetical protein